MNIKIKREGPRQPDADFIRAIREYNEAYGSPEVAIVWNTESVPLKNGYWDPRWEIWIEVTDNRHPGHVHLNHQITDAKFEGKTWRFLNTWEYPDGSFASLDDRLFVGLRIADTWADKNHYENTIEAKEASVKKATSDVIKDTAYGMRSKWMNYDRTQVGYGSTGNWRSKLFWR